MENDSRQVSLIHDVCKRFVNESPVRYFNALAAPWSLRFINLPRNSSWKMWTFSPTKPLPTTPKRDKKSRSLLDRLPNSVKIPRTGAEH